MKYIIKRDKGDQIAMPEMCNLLLHLSAWGIELIDIVIEPEEFIIVLSDNIPKDQEAHLNTTEKIEA